MSIKQPISQTERPVPFTWRMPWWRRVLWTILHAPFFVIMWWGLIMAMPWAYPAPVWQKAAAFAIGIFCSIPVVLLGWSPVSIKYDGRSVLLDIMFGLRAVRMSAMDLNKIDEPTSWLVILRTTSKSYFLVGVPKPVQRQLAAIILTDPDTPFVSHGEGI